MTLNKFLCIGGFFALFYAILFRTATVIGRSGDLSGEVLLITMMDLIWNASLFGDKMRALEIELDFLLGGLSSRRYALVRI